MGKNLRGKELGKGISQRKDGLYTARFTDKLGNRRQKYFKSLNECKKWLADSLAFDRLFNISPDITVEKWCQVWEQQKKNSVRITTYNNDVWASQLITESLGYMKMRDVKPLHIQNLINILADGGLKNSSLKYFKGVAHDIFERALDNDIVLKNPVNKSIKYNVGEESIPRKAMTIDQQISFMFAISGTRYENDFLFVLETGLRYGELVELRWNDIDFQNKCMCVSRTNRYVGSEWQVSPCKTMMSRRRIPLSDKAIDILRKQMVSNRQPDMSELNGSSGLVFCGIHGTTIQNRVYNRALKKIESKLNMDTPLSMHILRHTFATRCIECGMKPKTLQVILGHSNLNTTMNIYVHTTEDEKESELENALLILTDKLV